MLLDTRKSNLTEIRNSADKLRAGYYLQSPDLNKHQTDINNKTKSNAIPTTTNSNHHYHHHHAPITTILGVGT